MESEDWEAGRLLDEGEDILDVKAEERALVADLLAAGVREVRLPSDEEWVRLAGGEKGDRYPWDAMDGRGMKEESAILERANTAELGWQKTTPVYLYPLGESEPFKLMDLAGNVWEWVSGVGDGRAVRGGSWADHQRSACVAVRLDGHPHYRDDLIGFRLVAPVLSEF